jgi:hypothetical protein
MGSPSWMTAEGRYLNGPEEIMRMLEGPSSKAYLDKGCAHVMSVPLLNVEGDRAIALEHHRTYIREAGAPRPTTSRWEWHRQESGERKAVLGRTGCSTAGSGTHASAGNAPRVQAGFTVSGAGIHNGPGAAECASGRSHVTTFAGCEDAVSNKATRGNTRTL